MPCSIHSGPRETWSGRRDSNPQPSAWEADALPLRHTRSLRKFAGFKEAAKNLPLFLPIVNNSQALVLVACPQCEHVAANSSGGTPPLDVRVGRLPKLSTVSNIGRRFTQINAD